MKTETASVKDNRMTRVSKTLKITAVMILVLAGITAAGSTWWLTGWGEPARDLVLCGNVDMRQAPDQGVEPATLRPLIQKVVTPSDEQKGRGLPSDDSDVSK